MRSQDAAHLKIKHLDYVLPTIHRPPLSCPQLAHHRGIECHTGVHGRAMPLVVWNNAAGDFPNHVLNFPGQNENEGIGDLDVTQVGGLRMQSCGCIGARCLRWMGSRVMSFSLGLIRRRWHWWSLSGYRSFIEKWMMGSRTMQRNWRWGVCPRIVLHY